MTNFKIEPKKLIICVRLAAIALLSFTKGVDWAQNPESHRSQLEYLDEKQNDVLALSATSLTASTALTMIPGDAATPIANELAELSTYFIITICALLLEKCLLPVTGMLAFGLLIPAAMACFIYFTLFGRKSAGTLGIRLIALSLVTSLLVPTSVGISKAIEGSFVPSVDRTIEAVEETVDKIENSSESEKFSISKMLSGVTTGVTKLVDDIKNMTNDFIEAIAIMLVTACLIPVIVLMIFARGTKMFLESVVGLSVSKMRLPERKSLPEKQNN